MTSSGIVLRISPTKEYDAVVEFFTEAEGKIAIYGRGVRSPKSKRRQFLDTLAYLKFSYTDSKSKTGKKWMPNLTELNLAEGTKITNGDYGAAFSIAEMLSKLLPDQEPAPELFNSVVAAITHNSSSNTAAKALVFTSLRLLAILGYLPEIELCQNCGDKFSADVNLARVPGELGYVTASAALVGDAELKKILKVQLFALRAKNYTQFLQVKLEAQLLKKMVGIQLDWLEIVLGRGLKSREFALLWLKQLL